MSPWAGPHALVLEAYPVSRKPNCVSATAISAAVTCLRSSPRGPSGSPVLASHRTGAKKPLVVIGLLGWWAVIRYRLGLLSLEEALAKLSKRLGLRMRAVILPYANAAIDVDSIADLMLVRVRWQGRGGKRLASILSGLAPEIDTFSIPRDEIVASGPVVAHADRQFPAFVAAPTL